MDIKLGDPLPLFLQLGDAETNLFPRAEVRDATGAAVVGSPFALTHVASGMYKNTSYTPTVAGNYFAVYTVYTDAGFTTLSTYPRVSEFIEV